jgi:GMP reductase
MKQLNYSDVFLVPKKCVVDSRKDCRTSVTLGKRTFDMPIYPANMKSVVDYDACRFFARNKWFYTMHRFEVDLIDFLYKMNGLGHFTSVSVGVNQDSYDDLEKVYQELLTMDYITIDVANAWSDKTKKMINFIKEKFPESFLIVGNVATSEAVEELEKWGADAIKVGIAGGSVCITKNKTGVHRPMVSTVKDCCRHANVPIIADGGIVEHGDIAKAIACGATMVMAGSLFAGYDQSSGRTIEIEDWKKGHAEYTRYKEYYGSASKHNKNEYKNVEGKKILIPHRGDMSKLLTELKEDLQSSISYVGSSMLEGLRWSSLYEV